MPVLALHPDAKADLDGMSPADRATIAVCLQELESQPRLASNLLDHGFDEGHAGLYGVKKWSRLWKQGLDVWRLRLWDAEKQGLNYRIFYAYLPTQQRFYVLAVVPKDQVDYETPNSVLEIRIRAAFNSI